MSTWLVTYGDQSVELVLKDPDVLGAQRGVKRRERSVTERVEKELGVENIEFPELQIDCLGYYQPPNGHVYNDPTDQGVCGHCGKPLEGRYME